MLLILWEIKLCLTEACFIKVSEFKIHGLLFWHKKRTVACNFGGAALFVPETLGPAVPPRMPSSAMSVALNSTHTTVTSKSVSQAPLFFLNSSNFLLEIFICPIGCSLPRKMELLTLPLIYLTTRVLKKSPIQCIRILLNTSSLPRPQLTDLSVLCFLNKCILNLSPLLITHEQTFTPLQNCSTLFGPPSLPLN